MSIGIVVTYHGEIEFLPQALSSIAEQTILPKEVIVINDAHHSDPSKLVEQYNFKYIENPQNVGLAVSRNIGIEALDTDFYIPLDADDYLNKNCVQMYTDAIALDGFCYYYYSNIYLKQTGISYWKAKPFDISYLLRYNYISATACVPKWAWDGVNGYDNEFSNAGGWEDWAFYLKLFEFDVTGVHIPHPLFYRRIRSDSMIKKADNKKLRQLLELKFAKLYDLHGDVN